MFGESGDKPVLHTVQATQTNDLDGDGDMMREVNVDSRTLLCLGQCHCECISVLSVLMRA
jgi:hypothetical protein